MYLTQVQSATAGAVAVVEVPSIVVFVHRDGDVRIPHDSSVVYETLSGVVELGIVVERNDDPS